MSIIFEIISADHSKQIRDPVTFFKIQDGIPLNQR